MSLREIEYCGLVAEAWDALRGDTTEWPDRAFYREMIARSGEPVLDIGCGTGRLLLDYLAEGVDIDGVDNAPDMLAICRAKASDLGLSPVLHEQYVEQLDLPRRYRTILIPSSTLQLIVDWSEAVGALLRVRTHLEECGTVVASFMPLWREGRPFTRVEESSAPAEGAGGSYRRVARSIYDPETECVDTEDLYQFIVDGEVVREESYTRSKATRSYTPAQAAALFRDAGFAEITVRHGFTFDAARTETTVCTVSGSDAG